MLKNNEIYVTSVYASTQPASESASWATTRLIQSSHRGVSNPSHKADHDETYSSSALVSSWRAVWLPAGPTTPHSHVERLEILIALKPDVFASLHDNPGHEELDLITELLGARVCWPGMLVEEQSCMNACQRCRLGRKPATSSTAGHFTAWHPLEVFAIEITKLDLVSDGKIYLL